jgi:hypothetical protein
VSTCTYIHTQKVFSLVLGIRLRFLLIVRMSAAASAASVFDLRFLFRVLITFMPTCDLSPLPFKYAAFARRIKRESHRHRKRVFEHSLQHRQTYERQIRPKKLTERSLLGEKERGNRLDKGSNANLSEADSVRVCFSVSACKCVCVCKIERERERWKHFFQLKRYYFSLFPPKAHARKCCSVTFQFSLSY